MQRKRHHAMALDGHGAACRVISSNPGHCLWSGIVANARAEAVTQRLMADDVFAGWGLRRSPRASASTTR